MSGRALNHHTAQMSRCHLTYKRTRYGKNANSRNPLISIVFAIYLRTYYEGESFNRSNMMYKSMIIITAVLIIGGYLCADDIKGADMKTLTIRWQRLVDDKGHTCERCGATENEVQKAYQSLEKSFALLGIEVVLEEKALDSATCAKDISESNRIWINDRPLEEWLDAGVGESSCEFCCEELGPEVECRTVIHEGKTFETIPANLIVKAGLLVASRLLSADSKEPCCGEKPTGGCCPQSDTHSD